MATNEAKRLPVESIVEVSLGLKSETDLAKRAKANDAGPIYTVAEVVERFVTLKEAKVLLGLAYGQYVRRLLKDGKIEGIKVKVSGGTRWLVTRESIRRYEAERRVYTTYRNYVLKIDPKDEAAVRKFIEGLDPEYSLALQYDPDRKPTTKEDTVWAKVIEGIA